MYVLKDFCWKTAPEKFRFRKLTPADGASPSSQGKDNLDALVKDQAAGRADAEDCAWGAQIFLDCPVTMPRSKGS